MTKFTLNPNCSETVYRISGTLRQIKQSMFQLIDQMKTEEGGYKHKAKELDLIKADIGAAHALNELEQIWIPFTGSYETFFKVENPTTLAMATERGLWSENMPSNVTEGEEEEYHKIACYWRYSLAYIDEENNIVLKLQYRDEEDETDDITSDNKEFMEMQRQNKPKELLIFSGDGGKNFRKMFEGDNKFNGFIKASQKERDWATLQIKQFPDNRLIAFGNYVETPTMQIRLPEECKDEKLRAKLAILASLNSD